MALSRVKEREIAFQMLFAAQFSPDEETGALYEDLIEQWESEGAGESEYVKSVFFGAREYAPVALEKIRENAKGWKLERLSKTTLAILLLAIYEMDKVEDVPVKIAINEAVELSKRFDEEGSRKFVNGILGALAGK
jgi:N utilization substance protein B